MSTRIEEERREVGPNGTRELVNYSKKQDIKKINRWVEWLCYWEAEGVKHAFKTITYISHTHTLDTVKNITPLNVEYIVTEC